MSGLDQLRGFVQQNKTALAIAGAGVVGGLALTQGRKRDGAGEAADPVAAAAQRASTDGGPAYGLAAGYAPYDSTSSDLYAAIQPQIEYLQRLAEEQAGRNVIPVPEKKPATPKPSGLKAGFYKMAGTPNIYQVTSGGRIDYLTRKEFLAIKGSKKKLPITTISKDNPIFQNGAHWLDPSKQKVPGS